MKDYATYQGLNWFEHEQPWVLLYFSTTWCAPCKIMAPIMSELSACHGNEVNIVKVDVDEQMDVAKKFEVRGVPTLILLNENEVKSRLIGGNSSQQVERWLADSIKV